MRVRGVHCLVGVSLKRRVAGFPFSLLAVGAFPVSLFWDGLSLFPIFPL